MYLLIICQISQTTHNVKNERITNVNFSDFGMPSLLITDGSFIPRRIRAVTNRISGIISSST